MFYLTYRPKTIAETDNSSARLALSNILQAKQLPHALLFTGRKGTGKTSTARIFAKAINCQNNLFAGVGTSIEPCNTCDNCLSIDKGSSPDVTEMDAASNRGIDEIRTLIKEAGYSPMTGKYRVYIIDEAHMITTEGFNALLKTLEEPPKNTIFILATTNEEKIPSTIVSRCYKVVFGRAKKEDIIAMLNRVSKAESITIAPDVLQLISNRSDDSFRDAVKILEELVIHESLDIQKAEHYLGIRSKTFLLTTMAKGSETETLKWIDQYSNEGGDFKTLIEDLLLNLQELLLFKTKAKDIPKPPYDFTLKEIAMLMKLFQEAYNSLKFTPIMAIPLEIAVIEFYTRKTTISN